MMRGWPSAAEIALLMEAVEAMPQPRRSVYLQCARDHLAYGQVAARLGLTIDQVERHLAEALVDLIRALDAAIEPPTTLQ